MHPEWRVIAVVDIAAGRRLLPLICDAEPAFFRCAWQSIDDPHYDRWEVQVNFAEGESTGIKASRALLRTLHRLAESHGVPIRIVSGREWLDSASIRAGTDAGGPHAGNSPFRRRTG